MKSEANKNFKQECKIINLAAEYRGYKGNERYAIVTDLTEEELNTRFSVEIEKYRPFVILSRKMGIAIREHQRNENKYKKRVARGTVMIACDETDETVINDLSIEDEQMAKERESNILENRQRIAEASQRALMTLSALQRKYLILHYVDKKSCSEIAKAEGKNRKTVSDICKVAREKYMKAFSTMEVA